MPIVLHTDCRHYQGSMPCVFHKREGRLCDGCVDYDPIRSRILIVKLAAIGDVLRTDWLDRLTETEQQYCRVGGDLLNVYFDAPLSGDTENSVRYRYSRRFKTWWEERYASASCYCNDFDAEGVPGQCFYGQGKILVQANYGTLDLSPNLSTGLILFNTATSITFGPIALSGIEESYVHVFNPAGAWVFSRRIKSLTPSGPPLNYLTLNWSGSGIGGGSVTGANAYAGYTYLIGAIWMRWMTKALYAAGKQSKVLDMVVCNDAFAGGLAFSKSDYSFGTFVTGSRTDHTQLEPYTLLSVNQRGPEYQALLESRAGATFRALVVRAAADTTDK